MKTSSLKKCSSLTPDSIFDSLKVEENRAVSLKFGKWVNRILVRAALLSQLTKETRSIDDSQFMVFSRIKGYQSHFVSGLPSRPSLIFIKISISPSKWPSLADQEVMADRMGPASSSRGELPPPYHGVACCSLQASPCEKFRYIRITTSGF